MSWAKLDDAMGEHRKIQRTLRQSRPALALHFLAILHCARYLTDGFVEERFIDDVLPKRERIRAVNALVERGLWEKVECGYRVHDYLDYNPSRTQVLDRRSEERNRKSLARRQKTVVSGRTPAGVRPESALPDPTRPQLQQQETVLSSVVAPACEGAVPLSATDEDDLRQLAADVSSILQGAIDSLTTVETCRSPRMRAVVRTLASIEPHEPDRHERALRAAWEARSIAQAQNRAPNIVSLFAQRLAVAQPEREVL